MRLSFPLHRDVLFFLAPVLLGGFLLLVPAAKAATQYVSGTITTSTVWTSSTVYVVQGLTIGSGGTLTIRNGTIVKMAPLEYIDVAASGTLVVNGMATSSVYFTSLNDNSVGGTITSSTGNPAPGDWNTIEIDAGGVATMHSAIVRYGGYTAYNQNSYSNIYVASGTFSILNSQIASSSGSGISVTGSASTTITSDLLSNNTSEGLEVEHPYYANLTVTSSTFSYNGIGAGQLDYDTPLTFIASGNSASGAYAGFDVSNYISSTTTWFNAGIPYIVNGIIVSSSTTLTIDHGAVVKGLDSSAIIDIQGSLDVSGASTDPVYFTSLTDNSIDPGTNGTTTLNANPGDWAGLEVESMASATINNAIVRYGGTYVYPYSDSDVHVDGGSLTVLNSQIINSSNDGLSMTTGTSTITFSNVGANGHDGIYMAGGNVVISTSTIQGNAVYGFYNGDAVTSTAIAENNYWGAASGPMNPLNPSGAGDVVSSYVDFRHWLTSSPLGSATTSLGALGQYKSDGVTPIADGSSTTETTIVFGANLQSLVTSTEQLQIEVTTSTTFTNIANVTSSFVSPSSTVAATFAAFPESSSNGNYHWQARVVDSLGDASAWQSYSGNPTNFVISTIPLYTQITSPYPSTASTSNWSAAPYDDALPGTGCGASTSTISVCGCAITSAVEIMRSYGITTDVNGDDVNPLTLNNWLASSSGGYDSQGNLNWGYIPFYAETPSGTMRISYGSSDHITSPSNTWVNNWLNHSVYATGTVPVILTVTVPTGSGATTTHFVPATGFTIDPLNPATSTYTLRDPYFYNTSYLAQATSAHAWNYGNTYRGAHVFEPTSTTILPLALEYSIDSGHTLLITDPNGKKLGIDPATGIFYNGIPNSGEDDDQPGSRFLNIYSPVAGRYTLVLGGSGIYKLASYVFDGRHAPIPQIISSSTPAFGPSTGKAVYHQNYDSVNLSVSVLGE